MCSYEASEFFHQRWAKDHLKHLAPHVGNNAKHFNRVGRWIVKQILDYTDPKKRADVIVHCIKASLQYVSATWPTGFEEKAGDGNLVWSEKHAERERESLGVLV